MKMLDIGEMQIVVHNLPNNILRIIASYSNKIALALRYYKLAYYELGGKERVLEVNGFNIRINEQGNWVLDMGDRNEYSFKNRKYVDHLFGTTLQGLSCPILKLKMGGIEFDFHFIILDQTIGFEDCGKAMLTLFLESERPVELEKGKLLIYKEIYWTCNGMQNIQEVVENCEVYTTLVYCVYMSDKGIQYHYCKTAVNGHLYILIPNVLEWRE